MTTKYFKPRSLTWWCAAGLTLCGLVLAAAPAVPALDPLAGVIGRATDMSAAELVAVGLTLTGLRGAFDG